MTLALAEEALRVAQRVHPEVSYELRFLQAEAPAEGGWRLPGEPWAGRLEGCSKLFLLADEPPAQMASTLASALYLSSYYLGASVIGSVAGTAWAAGHWPGLALLLGACVLATGAVALWLRRLPT